MKKSDLIKSSLTIFQLMIFCLICLFVVSCNFPFDGSDDAASNPISLTDQDTKHKLSEHLNIKVYGGLNRIIKDRYLRILTTKNSFDFYIYQGKAKGIQYEMARELVSFLNKKHTKDKKLPNIQFEMIPVDNDQLIPMLLAGKGDIIAAGLTATEERMKRIQFATPYKIVDEVVVTRKSNGDAPFAGKAFFVRKSSSYWESLSQYNREIAKKLKVKIKPVKEELHTENIMELISLGKYDYTLADSYIAEMALKTFKDLYIHKSRSFGRKVKIAWSVRKNDKDLLKELNLFMPKIKLGSLLGNVFSRKYFSDMNRIVSKDFDIKTSKLSQYDDLFKKYSKKYGFDWRLTAALCFQESRFNQNTVNQWGAIGLFQIKQMTADEPYIKIPNIRGKTNAENNIHAGIKYLSWIKKRYFDTKKNMTDGARIRMTLAAYNAGPGRVLKAIKLAEKMGLDSNAWFRQVELAMLKMGKTEPVSYVSEINKRYVSFLLLGIEK